MCLYPRLIKNRKYTSNMKNGGVIPPCLDERTRWVPIGCQQCIECRKQKAREWQVRLMEDIKTNKNGKFITLTFKNESIKELIEEEELKQEGYDLDNAIATRSLRLFLERWRKEYKTSLRHWFITELGHNGTENIHLHGIVWTDINLTEVERIWKYGWVWKGKGERQENYVNEATVNYITKYVNKTDEKHKYYKSKVLTSPGIGKAYINTFNSKKNIYNENKTNETYRTRSGHKMVLPIYYRNKIYNEKERESLWIEKLNKQIRWVNGEKIDISKGEEEYYKTLQWYQKLNTELGYGNGKIDWSELQYEKERRKMLYDERIKKVPPAG